MIYIGILLMSHSHVYRKVGSTTALWAFSLVSSLISFRFQTYDRSLSNSTSPFAALAVIIANVRCSRESVSQVGEFINNFQFCPFTLVFCWFVRCTAFHVLVGVQPLSFFSADSYHMIVKLEPLSLAFLPLSCHSYPLHLHTQRS